MTKVALAVTLLSFIAVHTKAAAESPSEFGSRLAKEVAALLVFAEMGNIGARDKRCQGTTFPRSDISKIVDAEIAPIINGLSPAEGKPASVEATQKLLADLKKIPYAKFDNTTPAQQGYDQKMKEALAAFGATGMCASMSTMIQSVVHQKRQLIQQMTSPKMQRKP